MHLNNKNVLITGGTGNLGRVVVDKFLEHGARVTVNFRSEHKFEELKKYVQGKDNLHGFLADLTSEADVEYLFSRHLEEHGGLDILVHLTGGFWMGGDIAETPLEKWEAMIHLNLLSTFLCTKYAFSQMKEQRHGKIFTVASKTALELPPSMGAYSVSKAGVLALTETLAKEGKEFNVQVNAILPSIIDVEPNRKAMPDADYDSWIKPSEIAELLVTLCDDRLSGFYGTQIKMYGKL